MYNVKIVADSVDPRGNRLTTFELTFPRIILAQFSKHRMFSFNTSSSRAVPFEKVLKNVQENPFIPIAWQKEHKGMQGTEYINEVIANSNCKNTWLSARDKAIQMANTLHKDTGFQVTKQLCNRLLEPFMWVKVIMTTSEEGLKNFFKLRCPIYITDIGIFSSRKQTLEAYANIGEVGDLPSDLEWFAINASQADIHIQKLAEMMWDAYNESTPEELKEGEWHIPFKNMPFVGHLVTTIDVNNTYWKDYDTQNKVKISSALAARVSYTTIGSDLDIDYEKLLELHDRLVKDRHLSCFEHCARVMDTRDYYAYIKGEIPTGIDGHGNIFAYENYCYIYNDVFLEFEGQNPTLDESVYGWCNNLKGFIPYRYIIENGKKL